MIFSRKSIGYDNVNRWALTTRRSDLTLANLKEWLEPSHLPSNTHYTDNNNNISTYMRAALSEEKFVANAHLLTKENVELISKLFDLSFRAWVRPIKEFKKYGSSMTSFNYIIDGVIKNDVNKITDNLSLTRRSLKLPTSRWSSDFVQATNGYYNFNNFLNIENIKFFNTYFNQGKLDQDSLVKEAATKEILDYMFVANLLNKEDYTQLVSLDFQSSKIQDLLDYISKCCSILNAISEENIVIDNTQPFLLNTPSSYNQNSYLSQLEVCLLGFFCHQNKINEDGSIVTEESNHSDPKQIETTSYQRVYNTLDLLTTPNEVGTLNGLKIFSKIPKYFVDQLTDRLVIEEFMPIDLGLSPAFPKLKTDLKSTASDIQVSTFGDIAFLGSNANPTTLRASSKDLFPLNKSKLLDANKIENILKWNSNNVQQARAIPERTRAALELEREENQEDIRLIDVRESLENFVRAKKKVKALVFKKLLTGESEPLDLSVEEVSYIQLTAKHGFVPIMHKIKYNDRETIVNSLPPKEAYYLILAAPEDINTTLFKYVKCQEEIQGLLEHFADPELILFFSNKEEFLENQKKKTNGYGKYIDNFKVLQEVLKDTKALGMFVNEDNNTYQRINALKVKVDSVNLAVSKPKVNNENLKKLSIARNTVQEKIKENFNKFKDYTHQTQRYKDNKKQHLHQIELYNHQLRDLQNKISELNKKLTELNDASSLTKLTKDTKNYNDSLKVINKEWNSIQDQYKLEIKESLENGTFEVDSYISNLANNNVHIINIVFESGFTLNSQTDQNSIIEFRKNNALNNSKIQSIELVVDKVVKIKVDGENANCVYGGPYIINATSQGMTVGLLNRSSIFGKSPNSSEFKVHPHTATICYNDNNNDNEYKISFLRSLYQTKHRSCLGETAPYLYNAFNTGNLTMAIVNILIWLSSANSADMWGRSWNWFPKKYTDNGFVFSTPENIANLIIQSAEATEEEEEEEECEHEWEDGECIHCGYECDHDEHNDNGICLQCGAYHEWADEDTYEEYEVNNREPTPVQQTAYIPYVTLNNQNND